MRRANFRRELLHARWRWFCKTRPLIRTCGIITNEIIEIPSERQHNNTEFALRQSLGSSSRAR
jgi:hypothetical protein